MDGIMVRRLGLVVCAVYLGMLGGVVATGTPAAADTGWMIRYGVTWPPVYVGGPYESYNACTKVIAAYNYDWRYHCEEKSY